MEDENKVLQHFPLKSKHRIIGDAADKYIPTSEYFGESYEDLMKNCNLIGTEGVRIRTDKSFHSSPGTAE